MKKILLAIALVLLGTLAFSQERIAVFPFEDLDNVLTRSESIFFYRHFSNEFTNKNYDKFTIVPRQDVEKLINIEAGFQLSDFSAKEKTAEMQRVLNGTQILLGVIGRVGSRVSISVSLYTYPELSQLPGGVDKRFNSTDELFDNISGLVQSMRDAIANMDIRPPLPSGGNTTISTTARPNTSTPLVQPAPTNTAKDHLEKGKLFFDRADYDIAITELSEAIRLNPNYAEAYAYRARVYNSKNDYDRGFTDAERAIRLDPNYALGYFARGNVYRNKRDYDRAIADYNEAIRLDPNFADAYHNRGLTYENKRDYDRAIADYTQAIRLDPNYATAYYNRGLAYYNKRDYDQAIADYTQAIRLNPNYAITYYNRGNAYRSKRDYDRAITDYNEAIRLDSNFADAYNTRGNAYYNKKDYDRAIADYTQAIRLAPNAVYGYINRGDMYFFKRDYNRAIADYEAALRIDSNDPSAKLNLENARRARGW